MGHGLQNLVWAICYPMSTWMLVPLISLLVMLDCDPKSQTWLLFPEHECYTGSHSTRFILLIATLILFLPWACKLSLVSGDITALAAQSDPSWSFFTRLREGMLSSWLDEAHLPLSQDIGAMTSAAGRHSVVFPLAGTLLKVVLSIFSAAFAVPNQYDWQANFLSFSCVASGILLSLVAVTHPPYARETTNWTCDFMSLGCMYQRGVSRKRGRPVGCGNCHRFTDDFGWKGGGAGRGRGNRRVRRKEMRAKGEARRGEARRAPE